VHFLHIRSPEPDALPLVLSHGWPGSVAEYLDILDPLSDPRRHGLDPTIAFDLVVPSLPGFGFSGPTPDTGWGPQRIARAWVVLMRRLGYERYGAAGNDWGSFISLDLGRIAPDNMIGAHVAQAWSPPPDDNPAWLADLSPRDKAALAAFQHYADNEASYGAVQGPAAPNARTRARRLTRRPAWVERSSHARPGRRRTAHPCHDPLAHQHRRLGNPNLRRTRTRGSTRGPTTVPLGVAQFPNDLASVQTFAEHQHTNIVSWNHYNRGGHYAAHDAPDLLVGDIRQFFGTLRS
jgi:epoxide hydrolase